MEVLRGVFVRSDTNVEDMPNFSGAGLNLTIFNLTAFKDVLEGIKRVWASPFTYRSFSWRQSVISDPNLVFPSIVVLESVSSEKSGVLITADVDTGDPTRMTIATAEGVGGTVDGSPAETLLFSQGKALLLAQFKSPTRRMLVLTGRGGSRMVPSTGSEKVLTD
ncbi:MAG: phosphoenolpyruvate synthase, partial [Deltaproteobacteria bacterium]|nr:phosphoenolpyruvate synthase [Deltaproteobacteria bacterium]